MISAQESTTEKVMYDVNSFCSVYLADSSIKNAGFGVFAGKHFEIGERIVSGEKKKKSLSMKIST